MRLAILSDIHEDAVNLQLAIQKIEKLDVDEIICLGDIVGFSIPYYSYLSTRNASECVNIVRKNCKVVVCGNHDLFALRKLPNFQSEFSFPSNWYELSFDKRKKMAGKKVWLYEDKELSPLLKKKDIAYLNQLNEFEFVEMAGESFLFSHYILPDLSGSDIFMVSGPKNLKKHFTWMKDNKCMWSFCGHGHVDGYDVFEERRKREKGFVKTKVNTPPVCTIAPAIARNKGKSGFLIFDTNTKVIEGRRIIN